MTKALVIKCVTMGKGGIQNRPKLRDVIYGRLLNDLLDNFVVFHTFIKKCKSKEEFVMFLHVRPLST